MGNYDNIVLYYCLTLICGLYSLISLIIFVTYHVTKYSITKQYKARILDCICIIILGIGTYLLIPFSLFNIGENIDSLKVLEYAEKLSINPYEKRLLNIQIGMKYVLPCYVNDGNKAIKHFEKGISNDYAKNKHAIAHLMYLYTLKGDYDKAEKLTERFPMSMNWWHIPLILSGNYEKATEILLPGETNDDSYFLKAALYKQIGKKELSEEMLTEAKKIYSKKISDMREYSDQQIKMHEENIKNYQSIPAYKSYLEKERFRFGFKN